MKTSEEIFLEELKKEFIEKLKTDVENIRQAVAEKNHATIARIAHDIKGTIGIFGFHEGTGLALNLQLAAEEGVWPRIDASLAALMNYLVEKDIVR